MATNTEYYRNLLAFFVSQGTADQDPGEDEFTSFSDCYKSDWGFRPRCGWSRRRICEYFIARPEYGYGDDGTPLETLEDVQEYRAREMASEDGLWEAIDASMDEDTTIDPFDYDEVFRRRRIQRPSRAQFLRAVQA